MRKTLVLAFSATLLFAIGTASAADRPAAVQKTQDVFTGKYCQTGKDGKNLQLLEMLPDEQGTLRFGISVWYGATNKGGNCGITDVVARKVDGKWRYERQSKDPQENCILNIAVDDKGTIIVSPDKAARCLSSCGGGSGGFMEVNFPPKSRKTDTIKKEDLDARKFFRTTCAEKKPQQ